MVLQVNIDFEKLIKRFTNNIEMITNTCNWHVILGKK